MPILNKLVPAIYNALVAEPTNATPYISPPRNSRRYFEESGRGLIGTRPTGIETEAQIRSRIGAPYQDLVARLIGQTAMVGDPRANYDLKGTMYTSHDPAEYEPEAQIRLAKYLQDSETVPKGKRFFGVGANASPAVYAHEMRHEVKDELSNRIADLMYAGSEPAYKEAVRMLYDYAVFNDPKFREMPFKERYTKMYKKSLKEREKYILETLLPDIAFEIKREAPSREVGRTEERIKSNIELNRADARGAFDKSGKQIDRKLIEQRAKYPFLNFIGRFE
jgi:hypothetical protein